MDRALHKKLGTGMQLDLKPPIANRQVRNKDVQYPQQLLWLIAHGCQTLAIGECESAMFRTQQVTFCTKPDG